VQTRLGYPFRFVELAQEINASMPAYVARRVQDLLNDRGKAVKGASILLLGVTYKAGVADQRESPAVPLARRLHELGASICYHDPFVPRLRFDEIELECESDVLAALELVDVAVLLQSHEVYLAIEVNLVSSCRI
jgi:UDP-N-acetyl-D-glucosamine dehydrogenase